MKPSSLLSLSRHLILWCRWQNLVKISTPSRWSLLQHLCHPHIYLTAWCITLDKSQASSKSDIGTLSSSSFLLSNLGTRFFLGGKAVTIQVLRVKNKILCWFKNLNHDFYSKGIFLVILEKCKVLFTK
jgi:hypothetical protein